MDTKKIHGLSFIRKTPRYYYYLFSFLQMCPLLLSLWNLRTPDALPGFVLVSSNAIMLQVWKIFECLLECLPATVNICPHVFILRSSHSQWFRLQLTQISSGQKAVKFRDMVVGCMGFAQILYFLNFIYIGLYFLCFSLGHHNFPLSRKLKVKYRVTVDSQRRFGFQGHMQHTVFISQNLHLLWPSPPRDPTKHQLFNPKDIY